MKIGLIADIHGNDLALQAVLDDIQIAAEWMPIGYLET